MLTPMASVAISRSNIWFTGARASRVASVKRRLSALSSPDAAPTTARNARSESISRFCRSVRLTTKADSCPLKLLRFCAMSSFAIGVDLGGTNLRIAAVDVDGHLLEKVTTGTQVSKGRDFVIGEM